MKFFLLFVFTTGASIMAVEMAAFKAIVPYFGGGSIFVWAIIIFFAMVALSLGYYLGGMMADKFPKEEVIFSTVALAGGVIAVIPLAQRFFLITSDGRFVSNSFGGIVLLFSLPVFILGMTSPFLIRILNKKVETTGSATGTIYSFSTAGSIVGIYASSFLMLPLLGTRTTLFILSFILIAISVIGWIRKKGISLGSLQFIFLLSLSIVFYSFSFVEKEGILFEKESFYGLVQVKESEGHGLVLDINMSGRWSVYHPERVLTDMYFDYFTPLYLLLEEKEEIDVLIIGHAGGVISRQYSHYFENVRIDGLEIDPWVSYAAGKFFDIDKQKGLNVINEDGRLFLNRTDKKYDLIISDAYIGALYIPFHLATKEFFEIAKESLKEGGIFAQHVLGQKPEERVSRCLSQTIRSVFPNAYFVKTTDYENILLASKEKLEISTLKEKGNYQELDHLKERISDNFLEIEEGKCILTDNKAPTEMLRELDFSSA